MIAAFRASGIGLFFTVFEIQSGNLFGYQTDEKYKHGSDEKECAHVGKSLVLNKRVEVIKQAGEKKTEADREKQLQWRVKSANLENNKQKPNSIVDDTDMAFAFALAGDDRDVRDRVTGTEKAHRDRRRI
jgi:hypothetical protein